MSGPLHPVHARRLHLLTQDEAIVLMRSDCPICKSEGLAARARVQLRANGHEVVATLYQIESDLLASDEAGLSEAAWRRLAIADRDPIHVTQAPSLDSLAEVRRRIYGGRLGATALGEIIKDVVAGRYADVHLSAFLTACSAFPLDVREITHLTRAMVETGEQLTWNTSIVSDKHCVGGLPGNRTSPIVVAIAASCGLTMPKTSSRAITSPSGTADTMETLAPVDLDVAAMRRVVEREGGCIAWGGAMHLSPADDALIRIERALDIDTEGQLIASVLSKKVAAGATHVVFDIPIGPTAKVRTPEAAREISSHMETVAQAFGLKTRFIFSDGSQPVGRGIGPALEARDVLDVLQGTPAAPADLRARAIEVAGAVLELAGVAPPGEGQGAARAVLDDGRAWQKFQRICEAQGGMRQPPLAPLQQPLPAPRTGILTHINNRKLSRLAKLAGAPDDKAAGVELCVRLGDTVTATEPLVVVHAEARGELAYALAYAQANADMFEIET